MNWYFLVIELEKLTNMFYNIDLSSLDVLCE